MQCSAAKYKEATKIGNNLVQPIEPRLPDFPSTPTPMYTASQPASLLVLKTKKKELEMSDDVCYETLEVYPKKGR